MKSIEDFQSEALKICLIICEVCDKYNIKYYLAAGTLLGAVRHKGFIPWDDDIDLEIELKDYKRLKRALSIECSDSLVVQNFETDKRYPFPFTKVFLKNKITENKLYPYLNRSENGFVDIFPLGKCPTFKPFSKLFFKMVEVFTIVAKSKVIPEKFECQYKKKLARLIYKMLNFLPVSMLRALTQVTITFFNAISPNKLLCYPGGKYGYPNEIYQKKWYSHSEKLPFCGQYFNVPSCWNEILSYKYGDYMTPIDISERKGHYE